MKKSVTTWLTFATAVVLLSSCASDNILKSSKNDPPRIQAQVSPDSKMVSDLKTSQKLISELKTTQQLISELKKQLEHAKRNETELSAQIQKLKEEINEKDDLISIQGKVISLLDDTEQTLQKSIEAQFQGR